MTIHSRRAFLERAGLSVCSAAVSGCLHEERHGSTDTERPNIVVVMVDDMGFSDLGCFGGEIDTPNLDRLAGEGVRFSQFYNTAKCAPSRLSLLTGRYYQDVTLELNNSMTIAEVLKPVRYFTGVTGKWQPEGIQPTDRGFDRSFVHRSGMINHFTALLSQR